MTSDQSDADSIPALLDEILGDAGRTPLPGAAPVVALSEEDDPASVAAIEALALARIELRRRGVDHGTWVTLPSELEPAGRLPRPSQLRKRWREARPFVLRGALAEELPLARNELHAGLRRGQKVSSPQDLEAELRRSLGGRAARFEVIGAADELYDPERDLARVLVRDTQGGFDDLWVKTGRLSTYPEDTSLRLRFAFGAEREDDASDDEPRHRATAALGRAAIPELRLVGPGSALIERASEAADESLQATGAIAYWNAPEGGALFHHDAFSGDDSQGQRGVLYTQLVGRTAWLAISSADLVRRLEEFLADEEEPELADLATLAADQGAARAELALPGCGRFGPVVDGWPAFTAFLADSGHAAVLEPGDAIVLPNQGLGSTALHSVFCASPRTTYGLSVALRRDSRPHNRVRGQKMSGRTLRSGPGRRFDLRS
ncbi:hypothetical protein [Engelhardtia mirabilis]|uniref:Uncharacterized protein n=1 Tax=Engelhardtia mirabilis TaxID=2528011 RepID=A0A518BF36_9BACT|nr:hypothetical protein Pla133_06640 [Planctomycetes bacterium Pla133]QDU99924.1 hypothetical protein Pla86_06630 [Planctomycetes bacterium Pla86]